MARKGIDSTFLHFGVRTEDMSWGSRGAKLERKNEVRNT